MNLKEALKIINHLKGHEEFDKLRTFLQDQHDEIERLKGRTLLPGWFVIYLQKLNHFELKHENEITIEDVYGEGVHIKFSITKQPDGDMWELSEAGAK